MYSSEAFSKQRLVIYDLLNRAKNNHCTVTGTFEWDVTDTLARISVLQEENRLLLEKIKRMTQ